MASRNTDKYIYREVALPKEHPAIQRLVAEAKSTSTPLRSQIRIALIKYYSKPGETFDEEIDEGTDPDDELSPAPIRQSHSGQAAGKRVTRRRNAPQEEEFSGNSDSVSLDDILNGLPG